MTDDTDDTSSGSSDDALRKDAIERLRNKRAFRQHVVSYVVVNAVLVGVWAVTGAGYLWPIWVIGFWGIGLVMHAWTVYGEKPITEDEIRREMGKGGSTPP